MKNKNTTEQNNRLLRRKEIRKLINDLKEQIYSLQEELKESLAGDNIDQWKSVFPGVNFKDLPGKYVLYNGQKGILFDIFTEGTGVRVSFDIEEFDEPGFDWLNDGWTKPNRWITLDDLKDKQNTLTLDLSN